MWRFPRTLLCRISLCSSGYPMPRLAGGYCSRHCRRLAIKGDRSMSYLWTQVVESNHGGAPWVSLARRAALAIVSCGSVIWANSLNTEPVACQDIFMDNISEEDLSLSAVSPLEMNEVAALTHSSLLRQASGLTVDASLQLLHRALRATLDFSAQYRKQLNHVIDLMEWCTATLRNPEQHDKMWERLVASRSHMDSLKQQLKDLNILMNYAYTTLENAAMTAFISGVEFTASAAQQTIDNAKLEVVEKIEAGVSTAKIMEEFGIAKQAVSDIKRMKETHMKFSQEFDVNTSKSTVHEYEYARRIILDQMRCIHHLENDTKQNMALEVQYVHTHTRYIEVSQKLLDERERIAEVTEDSRDENPSGND